MNYRQLQEITDILKDIPDAGKRDKAVQLMLQTASDSITCEAISNLLGYGNNDGKNQDNECISLELTEKEISIMPKEIRKTFRTMGLTVHVRKRKSGKKHWNYEVRRYINGRTIAASSNNLAKAKEKFIIKFVEFKQHGETPKAVNIPNTFEGFANYFFDNFYSRKVSAETLRIAKNQCKNHLLPDLGKKDLKKITPKMCQNILDKLDQEGKGKTADDVFTTMNLVFKAAIKHNILQHNPLDMVFHTKHEREHGVAMSKEEEKLLLSSTAGTPYQLMYAIALYTGMRPNEYETARIEGKFIVTVNSKRKNGKVEYKKIPITPMLAPYLKGAEKIQFCSLRILRDRFNKLFPNHRLYDLRTTFYTRCQECGVAPVARDEFVGHSLGALGNTYTDLSDEFLLKEGQKFYYTYG